MILASVAVNITVHIINTFKNPDIFKGISTDVQIATLITSIYTGICKVSTDDNTALSLTTVPYLHKE